MLHYVENWPDESQPWQLQAGINGDQNSRLDLGAYMPNTTSSTLGVDAIDVMAAGGANKALEKLDLAINKLNRNRARAGFAMNALGFAASHNEVMRANQMESRSVLEDADVASETTEMTSRKILSQTAMSMLGQANQRQEVMLALIQNI